MISSFPFHLVFAADAISTVGVAYDYETFCFSGTYGGDELVLDSGYVGVENYF